MHGSFELAEEPFSVVEWSEELSLKRNVWGNFE